MAIRSTTARIYPASCSEGLCPLRHGEVCGHARGLALQLSQGQGRQPLASEGAPLAAGVRLICTSRIQV